MSSEHSEQANLIREQLKDSERVREGLEHELAKANNELELLVEKRHEYDALGRVCQSLEELNNAGGAHLFWEFGNHANEAGEFLGNAQQRISAFKTEVNRVEALRQGILEKISDQNSVVDELFYDLDEILEEQEALENEWLIEHEPRVLPYRAQVMPWSRGYEEDQRFSRSLRMSIAASIAVAILLASIAIPVVQEEAIPELPERVAKLVREERILPPPPPPPEPLLPEELPEPELTADQPPEPEPEASVAQTTKPNEREKVKSKGILAFRDSFARAQLRPTTRLGADARISTSGENAVGLPTRSMVTTSAPGSSGGINLASISRDVGPGGQGLEGVDVGRVASSIGGAEGPDRPLSAGRSAGRTDEEIQIVFDRYKAALYRLYNRALRANPTLRGQLVLQLTIEPDGSVSFCELYSSDMDAPTLASQVVARVTGFDFGAKEDIVAMTIIYPIDFLPAA